MATNTRERQKEHADLLRGVVCHTLMNDGIDRPTSVTRSGHCGPVMSFFTVNNLVDPSFLGTDCPHAFCVLSRSMSMRYEYLVHSVPGFICANFARLRMRSEHVASSRIAMSWWSPWKMLSFS